MIRNAFETLKIALFSVLIWTLTNPLLSSTIQAAGLGNRQLLSSNEQTCQLTYGWDVIKPYQYFDYKNRVIGFQVDLVRAIVKEMGCELRLHSGDWSTLIGDLKSGKVDFMADMTVTPERREFGSFSEPYRYETYSLYVRKGDYDKFAGKSMTQLVEAGFRLALTDGYLYSEEIEDIKRSPQLRKNLHFEKANFKNYRLLVDEQIDGFLEDSMVAGYTLRDAGLNDLVEALPTEYHRGKISFLLSKKTVSQELVNAFNKALAKVKLSDEYEKNWLKELK